MEEHTCGARIPQDLLMLTSYYLMYYSSKRKCGKIIGNRWSAGVRRVPGCAKVLLRAARLVCEASGVPLGDVGGWAVLEPRWRGGCPNHGQPGAAHRDDHGLGGGAGTQRLLLAHHFRQMY